MIIKKVTTIVSQKINLGNYETRDYSVGLDVDVEDGEDINSIIDNSRLICLEKTQEYYNEVKGVTDKLTENNKAIVEKINSCKNEEQLRSLTDLILKIENDIERKSIQRLFNTKLISIKTDV